MASALNMIRLLKDQSPIGEECTLCDNVFSLGDAAQIFGRGDSLKAYCLDCQEEKAEEKGLTIVIHEGKGSTSTTEKKSRKEGKKKRRQTAKNDKIKRGEKKLEVTSSKTVRPEPLPVDPEYLTGDEIVDLVQSGMDKLKAHYDEVLENAFQFLQNPANGEFPEFPIGENTLIREIARGIWNDKWFHSQLQLKGEKIVTHSLPEEQVDKCPATTAKGNPCQNKPDAENKIYCGSHKAKFENAEEKPVEKKGKKARKKKNLADQLGI